MGSLALATTVLSQVFSPLDKGATGTFADSLDVHEGHRGIPLELHLGNSSRASATGCSSERTNHRGSAADHQTPIFRTVFLPRHLDALENSLSCHVACRRDST